MSGVSCLVLTPGKKRGAQLRLGVGGAGRLRGAEQPVGDLGAPLQADPLQIHCPKGDRLRNAGSAGGRKRRPGGS